MDLLPCQEDAGLRSLKAEVLECAPAGDGFDAVLSRTPLYPEGGGQPSDGGTVGGVPVLSLRRREDGAVVHHLPTPVSGTVDVEVDWQRRYDLMQQHTAQHLLTATILERTGWRTIAFHLGPERSDVELDVPALADTDLRAIEAEVNARIREAHPVRVRVTDREHVADLGVRPLPTELGTTRPGFGIGPAITSTIWLKPYDLGVSQQLEVSLPVDPETGEYIARVRLQRLSGNVASWQRTLKPFLGAVRKQFLNWRVTTIGQREELFAEAKQLLQKANGNG